MNISKKERLYIKDILENPAIEHPTFYTLSAKLINNEHLIQSLIDIHSFEFKYYSTPKEHKEIFNSCQNGLFPIYKMRYAISFFGGRLMYLDSYGWKSLSATYDIFNLDNWLIA